MMYSWAWSTLNIIWTSQKAHVTEMDHNFFGCFMLVFPHHLLGMLPTLPFDHLNSRRVPRPCHQQRWDRQRHRLRRETWDVPMASEKSCRKWWGKGWGRRWGSLANQHLAHLCIHLMHLFVWQGRLLQKKLTLHFAANAVSVLSTAWVGWAWMWNQNHAGKWMMTMLDVSLPRKERNSWIIEITPECNSNQPKMVPT